MSKMVKYTLSDVGEVVGGATPSTKDESNYCGDFAWITPRDLSSFEGRYIKRGERNITLKGLNSCSARLLPKNTVLFSSRAPIGYTAIAENELCTNQGFKSIIANENKVNYLFLYYYLNFKKYEIEGLGSGTTFKEVSGSVLKKYEIMIPESIVEQKAIAETLSCLDDKIELNNKINANLELTAQAIFKSWFVDFEPFKDGEFVESELGRIPSGWMEGKAEDFFNISIGKTPPRKEPQWFTDDKNDVIWLSISNMGNCGVYISDSSEYLTAESVAKFNVNVVPDNTVILSFKLTVGRVAITNGQMTTNEAIAHFKTANQMIVEYLYCYLKTFNYQSLGSTSSIATAVNSKIIKAMPFIMPSKDVISKFYEIVSPIMQQIKANQIETTTLTNIRDILLPKLISGELKITDI